MSSPPIGVSVIIRSDLPTTRELLLHRNHPECNSIRDSPVAAESRKYNGKPLSLSAGGLTGGGKELQDGLGYYDYGARFYDPVIGRWGTVDPLAEHDDQIDKSPYAYGWNSPIVYNDPDGRCPECEENVQDPTEGQVYNSTGGATYTYDGTHWNRQGGEIEEVVVAAQGNGGWDNSKLALDIGGGIYGALETAVRPGDQWLGKNGKYYNNSWGGNQYTGSRSEAFKAASRYKLAGGATIVATAVIGGIETYNGYQMDGGQFGYNAQSAAAQTVGGIGGGIGGAALGAQIGGTFGVLFGGVGAIPGAVVGGFIGGYFGGELGRGAGQGAVNLYHRR